MLLTTSKFLLLRKILVKKIIAKNKCFERAISRISFFEVAILRIFFLREQGVINFKKASSMLNGASKYAIST